MKFKKLLVTNTVVLSMVFILLTFNVAMAQTNYWYDPTGDETDGRFLAVAGSGFDTFLNQPISLYIIVPATETGFEIGIFDGDTRGKDINGNEHWDQPVDSTQSYYRLFANPDKNGDAIEIKAWYGNDDNMPDNDWWSEELSVHEDARGVDGSYIYRLEIDLVDSNASAVNRFKVRSTAPLVLGAKAPFAFEAALKFFPADAQIIYPQWPTFPLPTTYDGSWMFKIYVTAAPSVVVNEVTIWDGDLDRGSYNGTNGDTDDPDTPNNEIPLFAGDATYEGAKGTGNPTDDTYPPVFRREPAIAYTVTAPDGTVWSNTNPSGNREWEKFTILTATHPDGCIPGVNADYCVEKLQQGIYTVNVQGVDLNNLNAFYFPYETMAYKTGSIGDYVWNDLDDNGIQDDGELGIEGVTVKLCNGQGTLVGTTATDATGFYMFPNLLAGDYIVKIVDSNFDAGGVLAGWNASQTNQGSDDAVDSDGDEISREVEVILVRGEDNNTIDFGFLKYGSIGDYVWSDLDADGIQDSGEKGIGGVTVGLYDDQGILLKTTTTDTNGYYLFDNLLAGDYTVKIADSNFATGGVLEGWITSPANQGSNDELDSDGNETTHQAAVALAAGEDNDTIDFGFARNGSIGDYVWHDRGHSQTHPVNGIQEDGEPGIAGVKVELDNAMGNLVDTTTTDSTGFYLFTDVPPGTYRVKIASSNFASGNVLAGWYASPRNRGGNDELDSDGDETNHEAVVTLAPLESNRTIDFGFFHTCISLQKTGPDSVNLGDKIVYHFRLENCGDLVHHGGAQVYDPLILKSGDHKIWNGVVWPGEVYEFDRTYTTIQGDCGNLVNTATAIGHPQHPDGYYLPNVTDEASWTVLVNCESGGEYHGCTPGYWKQKQHFDSWVKYKPGNRFAAIFGVPYHLTLLQALGKGGGGKNALGRHAVAALLNAASHGVNYYYTEQEIISMVQHAWATGDYETTKNLLAAENERGCPLN